MDVYDQSEWLSLFVFMCVKQLFWMILRQSTTGGNVRLPYVKFSEL